MTEVSPRQALLDAKQTLEEVIGAAMDEFADKTGLHVETIRIQNNCATYGGKTTNHHEVSVGVSM